MTICLPDEIATTAVAQAREAGYPTVDAYISRLVLEDSLDGLPGDFDMPAPPERSFRNRAELEERLHEGMRSLERGEGIVITPEYFRKMREEARLRFAKKSV